MSRKGNGAVQGGARGNGRMNVVAVIVIVAVVAAAFFGWRAFSSQEQGLYAIVHDGDGGTTVLPLDEDSETTVQTSLGYNVVVVEGGQVHVEDADCDNHDCIQQGAISEVGQQIICLPHKLWIEVSSSPEGSGASMDESATSEGSFDTLAR